MNSSYIEPAQRLYEKLFNDFALLLGMPSGLRIEKIAPLKVQISESTLVSVLTTDEIRELAGYKPLEKPLETKTTEARFSEEEAFWFELSKLGYYDDELEIISEKYLDYNPFDFEDISSKDRQIIDTLLSNPKTSVEELAEIVGESVKEVQERIDRLVENGLLEIEGTEIEVTDEGEEVAKEDGDTETTELITVYKYVERFNAPSLAPGGKSREFCLRMLGAGKNFTMAEIRSESIREQRDVFTKRGGWLTNRITQVRTPYCRHVWSARTVKVKKND